MANQPNRKSERHPRRDGTTITITRAMPNVIEYSFAEGDDEPTHTYHANRYATFHGPHTGRGGARQVLGPANTLWRERDDDLVKAFERRYPGATISLMK